MVIDEVSVRTLNISDEIKLNDRFFSSPWIINDKLTKRSNYYTNFFNNKSLSVNFLRLPFLITSEEAISFFKFPMGSNQLSAGITICESQKNNKKYHGNIIDSGDITIGKLRSTNLQSTIGISLNDLAKHMLITGTSGSGKSTFSVGLLHTLWAKYKIPFLVIEPAKNEYRALLNKIPEMQVFTPGKNSISPFVYNPFLPPKNVKLESYKNALKTAFSAAVSMSSPLDKIFEEAINNCYSDYHWLDSYVSEDKRKKDFNISDFIKCFSYTFEEIGYRGDASNIGKAGIVRLKSLINLFDNYYSIPIEDILSKPTIIELSAIENSDQKALIIALLLISILTYVNSNYDGKGDKLNNIILLEEAHTLLDSQSNLGIGEADPSGIAISLLKRMLAEMRSYGIGIVVADQSPRKVSADIIGLTDIKITFRLVETSDKKIICDSTNMTNNQMEKLTKLKPGEAMFFFGKLEQPEEIVVPNYREENDIEITISDNKLKELSTYWSKKQDKLRPYPECGFNHFCGDRCDYNCRLLAKEISRRIFRKEILANLSKGQHLSEIELVQNMFRHFTSLVKKELNGNEFSPKLVKCVKIFICRKIRYETKINITEENIKNLLEK